MKLSMLHFSALATPASAPNCSLTTWETKASGDYAVFGSDNQTYAEAEALCKTCNAILPVFRDVADAQDARFALNKIPNFK